MKRILMVCVLLVSTINIIMGQTNLTKENREKIINHVKQYCELLKDFSGNAENIELLDTILAKCENDKVQTFDDLATKHSTTDIEFNSMPLFQYLQNVTTKYDNELQMSFSDFKCEKVISEPSVSGDVPFSSSYAIVHVVKKIQGKGLDVAVPLKITVNTSNLKIGGTVSEKYEDPHSTYLRAMEYQQAGKVSIAREYFEKCTKYRTYSGRYRAMTRLGLSYAQEEKWKEAIDILTKASEHDPVGGISLAMILVQLETPLELRNVPKSMSLLEKYASIRDKDFPEAQIYANYTLGVLYWQGQIVPADMLKAYEYISKAENIALAQKEYDFHTIISFVSVILLRSIGSDISADTLIKELKIYEPLFNMIENETIRIKMGEVLYSTMTVAYRDLKQYDKALEAVEKLKPYNITKYYLQSALIYRETGQYEDAIKSYKMAADMGDAASCGVMFLYYYPLTNINDSNIDDFTKIIDHTHANKNKEKAIYYLKKAAEGGDLKSVANLAIMYLRDDYGMQDFKEGVKWALRRIDNGSELYTTTDREAYNLSEYIYALVIVDKHYEIVDMLESHSLKSSGANQILYCIFRAKDYPQVDSVKAFNYLIRGAELGDFICQEAIAYIYLEEQKDTVRAEQICLKLLEHNISYGIAMLGDIEKGRKHYDNALSYYKRAYESKDTSGAVDGALGLCKLYLEGLGVSKDPNTAMMYAQKALEYAEKTESGSGIEESKKLIEKCNAALGNTGAASPESLSVPSNTVDYLRQIANTELAADKRIALSSEALGKLFASNKVVVKTIGTNGSTIVATETAEDFLLRLSTSNNIANITILKCTTNEQGKITEMTVK